MLRGGHGSPAIASWRTALLRSAIFAARARLVYMVRARRNLTARANIPAAWTLEYVRAPNYWRAIRHAWADARLPALNISGAVLSRNA